VTAADTEYHKNGEPEPGEDGFVPYGERHTVRTPASEIKMRAVRWLWEDKIPLGEITLLAGREGLGKSTIAYTLAAWITQGTMKGWCKGTPRDVLVVATEDSWQHTICPRLIAAGADLSKVHQIEVKTGDIHDEISLPVDIELLKRDVEETDAVMILLDPLLSRLSANLDTHKDAESRKALEPLKRFTDEMQIAALGIIHVNKSNSADAMNSIMASRAFGAVARAVLMVVKNPEDDTCLVGLAKSNLGPKNQGCHRYRIVTARIGKADLGDEIITGRVEWDDHRTDRTIDEVVAELHETGMQGTSNVNEACAWARGFPQHGRRLQGVQARQGCRA
jgi:energy-coupling factor transporter ATP-binding protein EcfA2